MSESQDSSNKHPTPEQCEAVERLALKAAISAYGRDIDIEDRTAVLRGTFSAFAAISSVEHEHGRQRRSEGLYGVSLDTRHIAATAIYCISEKYSEADIHPNSLATAWVGPFVQACAALHTMSSLDSMLDDMGEQLGAEMGERAERVYDIFSKPTHRAVE